MDPSNIGWKLEGPLMFKLAKVGQVVPPEGSMRNTFKQDCISFEQDFVDKLETQHMVGKREGEEKEK